jgi:hypothetical protein
MDNYTIKRNMILAAFKWRDDIKKKSDDELYKQLFLFMMYISFISNMKYFYNNYDKTVIEKQNIYNDNINIMIDLD